jgi:hypothetical protein
MKERTALRVTRRCRLSIIRSNSRPPVNVPYVHCLLRASLGENCLSIAGRLAGLGCRSLPLHLANVTQFLAQCNMVQTFHGQRRKDGNTILEVACRHGEGRLALDLRALSTGRIFHTPMRSDRLKSSSTAKGAVYVKGQASQGTGHW